MTYFMNFSKNNNCEDIVENIDEKIIAHQEIVKTLPEIDSDNKNKKPRFYSLIIQINLK